MLRSFIMYLRYKNNLSQSFILMDMMRRSTKEVFEMRVSIQGQLLKSDREGKNTQLLQSNLDLLKWVLGEE